MAEWIASLLILVGSGFCLVAALGLVRFPDAFARMHAATKAGTLGLAFVCLAGLLLSDGWYHAAEIAVILLFMLATAPIGAHLLARAAFRTRSPIDRRTVIEPRAEAFREGPDGRAVSPSSAPGDPATPRSAPH